MAFLIPDKILDTLICDICNKYLSVQPVKVYPNRRIKCGRCVRNKKQGDGVISLFGLIADECLFKCINRFDGCREILLYSQVKDHERTCISKLYMCPICPEPNELPSLLLEQHFHKKHEQYVLKYPVFFPNLNALSESSEVFLYSLEDSLFFVYFIYSHSEDNMRFNISFLGNCEQAGSVIQQFWISDNEAVEISTEKRPCTCFEMENDWFCVKLSNMGNNKSIVVKFDLKITDPQFWRIPCGAIQSNEHSNEIATLGPSLDVGLSMDTSMGLSFKPMVGPFKPRKIYLTTNLYRVHDISPSPSATAIIDLGRLIFLQCINCLEICYVVHDTFYICDAGEQHSLCYFCFQFLNHCKFIREVNYIQKKIVPDIMSDIKFACKWGCGRMFSVQSVHRRYGVPTQFIDHLSHEETCKFQKCHSCPLPTCQFQGTLLDFKDHFSSGKHNAVLFFPLHYYYGTLIRDIILFVNNHFILIGVNRCANVMQIVINNINSGDDNNIKIIALIFDNEKHFLKDFVNKVNFRHSNNSYYLKIIVLG
ncbi:unnamed protein product [Phaedon cochleariae]|uniref:SIAH-type domain-containing protein n=1 Tax=Phaedon cochleariae TaxID=80249 RepID=A0A9N9SFL9_PHACE|nr:unnamed protein product [Phaedon cochleariae]